MLDDSNRKPNKICADKGSEFYNSLFEKWFKDNDIEMFSAHNEGKFVVAERFIQTLKIKIYKYMTSISKNVYIDQLHDTVNEYNNTYNRTMKMKSVDVKDNILIFKKKFFFFFFFYLGFLSRTFTIHGTAGEGGGYLFNSSLPLPPASQTLRH